MQGKRERIELDYVDKPTINRFWCAILLIYPVTSVGKHMDRKQVLEVLNRTKPALQRQYGVQSLALFGSVVRNEAREDSDVDILVGFDGPSSSRQYFGVQFLLEDLLGRTVDLVTEKALRPELRPFIEKEKVDV